VPGRLDGDAFVVIAINLNEEGLTHLADRLRALVEESGLPWAKDLIRIDVSTGVAIARLGDTKDSLLNRVERAIAEDAPETASAAEDPAESAVADGGRDDPPEKPVAAGGSDDTTETPD
jgi:hypothetical protein